MALWGKNLLEKYFLLKPGLRNFNHGSFGAVPRPVMEHLVALLHEEESFPDEWFRERYLVHKEESRRLLAALIRSDLEEIVLVENASYAVNSVLRSFAFQRGDQVLVFSSAYRMVTETLLHLERTLGVEVVVVDLAFPLASPEDLLHAAKKTFESHNAIKFCIFSHISSMPTLIEPVQELTALAKKYHATVLIDGAHAPGVVSIDVSEIGADFYTGNCHKWLFAPKGCAFLWTSKAYLEANPQSPQPVVISSTGWHDYCGRFAYTGTRDYTAFAALPAAFDFINKELGGMQKMHSYCHQLLREGCNYLIEQWKTSYLVPFSMQAVMANVVLPCKTLDEANCLQVKLHRERDIYIVVGSVKAATGPEGGESSELVFVRISAQIYLEMSDFHVLATSVKELLTLE